ncbi:hypothetical protein BX666DRAFT_881282 [Dichotomocladium elegans]|nr:hypothetical protein BX666DRAFT_881282 [Dichotomocladium elegans]
MPAEKSTEERTCNSSHHHSIHHPCARCDTEDALADRRSAHNALERQRREHLNTKFQELAHTLPSLQNTRRPSKTMIVTKSLEYVSESIHRESNYKKQIRKLRQLNESLRHQASFVMTQYLIFDDPTLLAPSSAVYGPPAPPMSLSIATTTDLDSTSRLSLPQ